MSLRGLKQAVAIFRFVIKKNLRKIPTVALLLRNDEFIYKPKRDNS